MPVWVGNTVRRSLMKEWPATVQYIVLKSTTKLDNLHCVWATRFPVDYGLVVLRESRGPDVGPAHRVAGNVRHIGCGGVERAGDTFKYERIAIVNKCFHYWSRYGS
jgi:hypothetical protein